MDEDEKIHSNTWQVDDLDDGLSADLSNLHGLGSQDIINSSNPAYDMTEVLQLQMFKEETFENNDLLQSLNNSLQESLNNVSLKNYQYSHMEVGSLDHVPLSVNHSAACSEGKLILNEIEGLQPVQCFISLTAPTAPGRKLEEETLTWLNQSQSYEIIICCKNKEKFVKERMIKMIVSIGFQERQHQYFEYEKYDEWVLNRPNEKMLELDVPMCLGIHNPSHVGQYTNEIEFQCDCSKEAKLFVKVNCLSSEFTKGKGESGVPLRLQIEVFHSSDLIYAAGCQVKVFRAKGANRKLKLGKEKHESLSKELANESVDGFYFESNYEAIAGQLQPSQDLTIFKKLEQSERLHRKNSDTPIKAELGVSGISPTHLSQLTIVNDSCCQSSTADCISLVDSSDMSCSSNSKNEMSVSVYLSANYNVEETQTWLRHNRFHNYLNCFTNFTGADLLCLSRNDLIQLCGTADGIRLNNCLQSRASRPLLTMYVSPEWYQSGSGMREYRAMFLEQLTVEDLKRKLAKKCYLNENEIIAIMKQGPTGIHIHVDDEVVRNFVDEAHHVVEILKDSATHKSRILLK